MNWFRTDFLVNGVDHTRGAMHLPGLAEPAWFAFDVPAVTA